MRYGATVPPFHGGYLPTDNSNTGNSDRYCIHNVDCHNYQKSKASENIVIFETNSLDEMKKYLDGLPRLEGGIKCCGTCLKNINWVEMVSATDWVIGHFPKCC